MSEFGESMDTGAPMDTAESKVIKNIVCCAHHSLRKLKKKLVWNCWTVIDWKKKKKKFHYILRSFPLDRTLLIPLYSKLTCLFPYTFWLILQEEDDYDVMQDPEFLQSVLENLPGVDPNNEAIRNAMGSLASQSGNKQEGKKDEEKKK